MDPTALTMLQDCPLKYPLRVTLMLLSEACARASVKQAKTHPAVQDDESTIHNIWHMAEFQSLWRDFTFS